MITNSQVAASLEMLLGAVNEDLAQVVRRREAEQAVIGEELAALAVAGRFTEIASEAARAPERVKSYEDLAALVQQFADDVERLSARYDLILTGTHPDYARENTALPTDTVAVPVELPAERGPLSNGSSPVKWTKRGQSYPLTTICATLARHGDKLGIKRLCEVLPDDEYARRLLLEPQLKYDLRRQLVRKQLVTGNMNCLALTSRGWEFSKGGDQ